MTTGRPDNATENPDLPTTTENPEKVVYTTIRFVTKEYLMSNFPDTVVEDSDNSTEALAATTSVPSGEPSVEPSGNENTTNTQVSDQKTDKHSERDKQPPRKQDHQSAQRLNGTSGVHNSTHTGSELHSNDTQLHSNHTGSDHNSTHTGIHQLPSNHTDGQHHSNHTSSGVSPLSSFYFLFYLPLVTTMWYLV